MAISPFLLGMLAGLVVAEANRALAKQLQRYSNRNAPKPLPVPGVKPNQLFKTPPGHWPVVVGHEDDHAVWAVVRVDQLPVPPLPDSAESAA